MIAVALDLQCGERRAAVHPQRYLIVKCQHSPNGTLIQNVLYHQQHLYSKLLQNICCGTLNVIEMFPRGKRETECLLKSCLKAYQSQTFREQASKVWL